MEESHVIALHAVKANICEMTFLLHEIGKNSAWITRIFLRIIGEGLFGKEFMRECVLNRALRNL